MLPGLVNPVGLLYTTSDLPDSTSQLNGGIAVSSTGQVHTTIVANGNDTYINSYRVSPIGQLVVQTQGTIVCVIGGIARAANGAVIMMPPDTAPDNTCPYVNRVRTTGAGMLLTTSIPVVTPTTLRAFSAGFSNGFK